MSYRGFISSDISIQARISYVVRRCVHHYNIRCLGISSSQKQKVKSNWMFHVEFLGSPVRANNYCQRSLQVLPRNRVSYFRSLARLEKASFPSCLERHVHNLSFAFLRRREYRSYTSVLEAAWQRSLCEYIDPPFFFCATIAN